MRLPKILRLVSWVGAALLTGSAFASSETAVTGSVQFWKKDCSTVPAGLPCLPEAISGRLPIQAVLPEPAPGQLTVASARAEAQGPEGETLLLELGFFRKSARSDQEGYLATQWRLFKDGALLAECSRYDKVDMGSYHPVGACSAMTDAVQVGVSFFKD